MEPIKGRIHSIETCGMVDGPGLRFVAFLQGCPLRCKYCHNPDTWNYQGGQEMTARELVEEAARYKTWMQTSGGGITLSGGEPLLQPEFTLEVIRLAHQRKMTVALDTSGFGSLSRIKECLDEVDLVLLDIKTAVPEEYKALTGVSADKPLATLEYLKEIGKPVWVRHVVVPGLTDHRENLEALKHLLMDMTNLEKLEFLPFHKMGEDKWDQMGKAYTLKNTPTPEQSFMDQLQQEFIRAGLPMVEKGRILAGGCLTA